MLRHWLDGADTVGAVVGLERAPCAPDRVGRAERRRRPEQCPPEIRRFANGVDGVADPLDVGRRVEREVGRAVDDLRPVVPRHVRNLGVLRADVHRIEQPRVERGGNTVGQQRMPTKDVQVLAGDALTATPRRDERDYWPEQRRASVATSVHGSRQGVYTDSGADDGNCHCCDGNCHEGAVGESQPAQPSATSSRSFTGSSGVHPYRCGRTALRAGCGR